MTEYLRDSDPGTCYGCGACEQVCPKKAIRMKPNEEGFLYPNLEEGTCIKCGLCVKVCPHDQALMMSGEPLKVFAAQYKDKDVLQTSASGGLFSAIADYVLKIGGAVSGCVFDDCFKAIHVVTEEVTTIRKMQGSKYVQSDIGNSFSDIQRRLKAGQFVLFSGTPCQVDGLKKYLLKDYKNLLTIDLICHGVPSPALFAEYLNDTEQTRGKVTDIKFRNKIRNGWCPQGSLSYQKGHTEKTYTISPYSDSYYYLYYLANNTSRMSCYSCKYASIQRAGDISIGDYWGIQEERPDIDPKGGISVVLVNSRRGQILMEMLQTQLNLHQTELAPAMRHNGNLSKPCDMPESRRELYKRIREQGYATVTKQDCRYQYVMPFLRKYMPKALKKYLKKFLH